MKLCLTSKDLQPVRSVYVCTYIHIHANKYAISVYYWECVDEIKLLVSNHVVHLEFLSNSFLFCLGEFIVIHFPLSVGFCHHIYIYLLEMLLMFE